MFRLFVVLELLSFLYGLPNDQQHVVKNQEERIINGEDTTIEKHPFQVSLIINDGKINNICGGSIISDKWILTAANCMKNVKTIKIRAGSSNLHSGGAAYDSTNYTVHPKYNYKRHDNDVAVVYITEGMKLNNTTMKVVSLASSSTSLATGTITTLSGWGTTKQPYQQTSEKLQSIQVPIVDTVHCRKFYVFINIKFTDNMFCAGNIMERVKGPCKGDYGGPLVLGDGTQVGIASFGNGCTNSYLVAVYAKVATLRSWIQKTTGV